MRGEGRRRDGEKGKVRRDDGDRTTRWEEVERKWEREVDGGNVN